MMITGTGIDIVNIKRIRKLLDEHSERFINKILSPDEKLKIPAVKQEEYIAGRFAAKEALAKATEEQFIFTQVSVMNDSKGKPYFTGDFISESFAGKRLHLSISHDTDYATAFVIIENTEGKL